MAWTVDLRSLDDATLETESVAFRTAQATWAADGTGAFEIDLSKAQGTSGVWLFGKRRVVFNQDSTRIFAGWLENLSRSGVPSSGVAYKAVGRGLSSHLAYRFVHGDFNQVDLARTDIAKALIAHITAQDDDKSNFSAGTISGVSGDVSRYYTDGDEIQDSIDELAQTQDGGFAWEIDANGAFNAWVDGRGSDKSDTHSVGDGDCSDFELTADTSEVASYVTGLGNANQNTQTCGPPLTIDTDSGLLSDGYGRREAVVETDTNDATEMSGLTQEEMRSRKAGLIALTTTWIEGRGPWDFGDVWIGDVVTGQLGDEFGGDTAIRCNGVQLTLEAGPEGSSEFVQMTWEAA